MNDGRVGQFRSFRMDFLQIFDITLFGLEEISLLNLNVFEVAEVASKLFRTFI